MFLRTVSLILAFLMAGAAAAKPPASAPQYQSPFMRVELAADHPAFVVLAVDSLGHSKLGANPLRPVGKSGHKYEIRRAGRRVEYRPAGAPGSTPPAWTFEFSARRIRLTSAYSATFSPPPLVLNFNSHVSHATLLGHMKEDGSVRLPAILHLPDLGTFRITTSAGPGLTLGYEAARYRESVKDYVKVTFPAPTAARPRVGYSLEVVDIYPGAPSLAKDPRFDGFRRDWLNIFQLSPSRRALANNAASDACAITVYEYSAVAERTPPLAAGLTALGLIRETLDRYLSGMKGCGMVGYTPIDPTLHYDYLDAYPSLLIAASDYVRSSDDGVWLKKNYAGIKVWATKLLAMDKDDGLVEYPESGDSGIWDKKFSRHAANWWDTIGFGHKDAYSNALAYHALLGMADLAKRAGESQDVRLYASRAAKLRSAYFKTFYDPATGVLAGWKSADGKLHDYYFTFVNSMAITYGLVPQNRANQIMDHLLAKMKDVGYTHFEYGLPGNLIFVPDYDYLEPRPSYGGGGRKGFQNYENGGATACFAYFTIKALYQLGRRKEADAILFPLLRGFEAGGFQGRGAHDRSYDWKTWKGEARGYEGLLVDNYMALLAVLSR